MGVPKFGGTSFLGSLEKGSCYLGYYIRVPYFLKLTRLEYGLGFGGIEGTSLHHYRRTPITACMGDRLYLKPQKYAKYWSKTHKRVLFYILLGSRYSIFVGCRILEGFGLMDWGLGFRV